MGYGRMGLGVESTNRVKFLPVPARTKRERISDPANFLTKDIS
jgi:hypothetical protein